MDTPQLPPELQRLERELAARPCPEPSADLRERVMRSAGAALEHAGPAGARLAEGPASGWWAFAVATAATVLVWVNLSLSAAQATSYDRHLPAESRSIEASARQIRELVPEVSRQEALRQAMILQAGSELVRCPSVVGGPQARDRMHRLNDFLP